MRQIRFSRASGFTLIELMISITLSLLVLAGVLGAYLAGSQANQHMQQRVALQQDARFAMAGLTRELRMAGSFGCALPNPTIGTLTLIDSVPAGSDVWKHYASNTIGVSTGSSAWVSAAGFVPSGDALVIQYGAGGVDATVTKDASGTVINGIAATLPPDRPQLASAAVLALTNCQRLELISNNSTMAGNVLNITPTGGVTLPSTGESDQWEVMRLVSLAYVIGTYRGRQGLYLFELDEDGQWRGPKEIANGATALRTEFGIQQCTPGTTDDVKTQFFSTVSGSDWKKIGLVKLSLDIERKGLSAATGGEDTIERTYTTTVVLRRENLCVNQSAS